MVESRAQILGAQSIRRRATSVSRSRHVLVDGRRGAREPTGHHHQRSVVPTDDRTRPTRAHGVSSTGVTGVHAPPNDGDGKRHPLHRRRIHRSSHRARRGRPRHRYLWAISDGCHLRNPWHSRARPHIVAHARRQDFDSRRRLNGDAQRGPRRHVWLARLLHQRPRRTTRAAAPRIDRRPDGR